MTAMVPRRLTKLARFLAWRILPGRVPLWWHVGRPNFGDDINPSFFRALGGHSVRFAADRRRPHLLGAGSILGKAGPHSVVCGSGYLEPPAEPLPRSAVLVAVRGERSLAACGGRGDVLLGDPLVLVDGLVRPPPKRHRHGLVPHVLSVPRWRAAAGPDLPVIDPGADPWQVVEAIASCEVVLSQSLHGLIVADALGIPNVWIAPADAMAGGRFKFDDYFTTLDAPKPRVPETPELFTRPGVFAASLGRYRYSKDDYRRALAAACRRLAERSAA